MAPFLMMRLYRRIGRRYPYIFLTVEMQSAFVITGATLGLFSFYYNASASDYLKILAVALVLTGLAVLVTLLRTYPLMRPLKEWIGGARDEEATRRAWSTAVALPLALIRRDVAVPILVAVVPTCVWAVIVLNLSWPAFFPLFAGSMIALGYSAILHYLVLEAGMRPVLLDINESEVTPRLSAGISAIPLRVRLMTALPSASTSWSPSPWRPRFPSTSPSFSRSPSCARSRTSSAPPKRYARAAIAERERIREAFGTYLDKSVAEYILSEEFPEEGVELEVSVLFCDVRDFTSFAAQAEAKDVVMRLNAMFAVVVPIVTRHGGHVDKFVGDGLLAVFGAPEPYRDHADRAVRAACEMASTVNSEDEPGFHIGVGVNTGRVVAGSIGGAGRLNFSVIGDAVNVAARVEAATREVGEDVLITEATVEQLSDDIEAADCGEVELKGIPEPMRLNAPRLRAPAPPATGEEPLAVPHGDGAPGSLGGARSDRELSGERRHTGGLAPL